MRRLALAATLLLLAVRPAAAAPPALSPLHAVDDRAHGGRVVDARGRTVLLRGVDDNALGQYWQGSRFPPVFPLDPRDPERMAAIGWDAVRLVVSWSRIEPRPGVYDDAYLRRVDRAVAGFARAGIYTILDMHQDAWGPATAAAPGQVCPAGALPAVGWDGAPAWATLDGREPRCFTSQRELDPATMHEWSAFFANARGPGGVGIQTRFARMWTHVARHFARATPIAGFDLLNEPNAFGPAANAAMSRMYARVLTAVRRGERAGRGRRHLVLFEPSVLYSAIGSGAPPAFSHDPGLVYSPHIYTGAFDHKPITRAAFLTVRADARALGGLPVVTGEWGNDPARAGPHGDGYYRRHQALQDEFRIGATAWLWKESCGDPHRINDLRQGHVHVGFGLFHVDCRTNTITGPQRAAVRDLTRPYVRAAPGRLVREHYDDATGAFAASGVATHGAGPLEVFYPRAQEGGMRVRTAGLGAARSVAAPGGGRYLSAPARGGRWTVRIAAR